ncbi:MAG: cyanophycin synthetase [Chloroflexi bacterium]|nr:cyanophycin synthetase [Chloroflexota bacterium]
MAWLTAEILADVAPRLGIELQLEPVYGYVGQLVLPDGRRRYFRNTSFDVNGHGSAEIARDKDYCAYFLRRLGYPVPDGFTFFSEAWGRVVRSDRGVAAAYEYARARGFPVVVKPNSRSHGLGVAKVFDKKDLYAASRAVFRTAEDRVALVQPFLAGDDYRLVVLDGAVVAAYERRPLSIVGDGERTIDALVSSRLVELASAGRRISTPLDLAALTRRLRRQGLGLDSVLAPGRRLAVLDNANLSAGGEAADVTEEIHDGFRRVALSAARDLGLRYCGVDLLTQGRIDEPPLDYVILELNAAPGLDHYGRMGASQRQRVEAIYERLLRLLIRLD